MPVTNLSDYRSVLSLCKKRGVEIHGIVVHPDTVVALVIEIRNIGEDPFPRCKRTWRRLWRKPDIRLFLFGLPVVCNPCVPVGRIGTMSLMPLPPDIAELFKGGLIIGQPEHQGHSNIGVCAEVAGRVGGAPQNPSGEPGVLSMLGESVNAEAASMSDLLIKAMENVDSASGLIVLRFWNDRFDVTTSFNHLECQAVLQRATMQIMARGADAGGLSGFSSGT